MGYKQHKRYKMKFTTNTKESQHSEEIQDIISAPPAWLLRWGITLFFTVLTMIISTSFFITYPDIVKTQLKIRSSNPAMQVTTKAPGKLIKLLVQNNEVVKQGQPIAYIQDNNGKNTLTALQDGKLTYAGIIYENQQLTNKTLFNIAPNNEILFGEMVIPPNSMGKVKPGQEVLIMLKSYSYEQYGMMHGIIEYITNVPFKEDTYIAKVDFNIESIMNFKKSVGLKQGMVADAEIITQNLTVLQRITRNLIKVIK